MSSQEAKIPQRLVIATGNTRKARAYYREYPIKNVITFDPEKDFGVTESESRDPQQVAWEKTNVVVGNLLESWPDDTEFIVTANDIAAAWARTLPDLKDPKKRKELHKISRYLKRLTDPREKKTLVNRIKEETLQMYCNGRFYMLWRIGAAVQIPSNRTSNTGVLTIIGCFNQLHEDIVISAFEDESAYHMSTRAPIAKVAAEYTRSLTIRNSLGKVENINQPILWKLVVEGILPYSTFSSLLLEQNIHESSDKKYEEVPLDLPHIVQYLKV